MSHCIKELFSVMLGDTMALQLYLQEKSNGIKMCAHNS